MIKVYSHSEVGGHAENEDAFIVEQHPADGNSGYAHWQTDKVVAPVAVVLPMLPLMKCWISQRANQRVFW